MDVLSFITQSDAKAAVLGAIIVVLLIWVVRLEFKLSRLTRGASGKNLEDAIATLLNESREIKVFRDELSHYLTGVERRLKRSVQGVRTIRFNPFKGSGMGGNQSFSTALINEEGEGVILSGLYARDHVSLFSKHIHDWKSENELSDEEKRVLDEAKEILTNAS